MRLHIAADHAGYELKQLLVTYLEAGGHEVTDHGAYEFDENDDYPGFCFAAGEAVAADPDSLGIVLGGSGNGEQIAANKVKGVRAALAWSVQTAMLGRAHNDANVVALGWRQHGLVEATEIIEAFIATEFTGEERHVRRIGQIAAYEARQA